VQTRACIIHNITRVPNTLASSLLTILSPSFFSFHSYFISDPFSPVSLVHSLPSLLPLPLSADLLVLLEICCRIFLSVRYLHGKRTGARNMGMMEKYRNAHVLNARSIWISFLLYFVKVDGKGESSSCFFYAIEILLTRGCCERNKKRFYPPFDVFYNSETNRKSVLAVNPFSRNHRESLEV